MRIIIVALLAPLLFACAKIETSAPAADAGSAAVDVVKTVYDGFAAGDMAKVTGAMAAGVEWNEAESSPYADGSPYVGPDSVLSGLFARLGGEWEGFAAVPEQMVADGADVVVFGRYHGKYLATEKTLDAQFVHHWTVKDGKIVSFQQYTDTAQHQSVMSE